MALTKRAFWSEFDAPSWEREGADWPLREHSRFVGAAGFTWHVQTLGRGPVALLLHGTGAATHSWRDVGPRLAERFFVIAPDLPGHGFTQRPPELRMTLAGLSAALEALLEALGLRPDLVVGHSAGAAIAVRMLTERRIAPRLLVGINGAFFPFRGFAARFFSPVARLASRTTLPPLVVARRARDPKTVAQLIEGTGSRLDARGVELYQRLVAKPGHVAAALAMMAGWDLSNMRRDLAALNARSLFLAGSEDRAVDPIESRRAAALARGETHYLVGAGHLAHEEHPAEAAEQILRSWSALAAVS